MVVAATNAIHLQALAVSALGASANVVESVSLVAKTLWKALAIPMAAKGLQAYLQAARHQLLVVTRRHALANALMEEDLLVFYLTTGQLFSAQPREQHTNIELHILPTK